MADKKITQLPSLSFISGSTSGYYAGEVVLPIVHNNTTVKMEAQKFALYATQWSATTASNTFIGNQLINGNVVITGNITAQEIHTEITSASIIFESGSTLFGNSADDTHTFTGTININGKVVGNAPLDYTSQSLNIQTGSQESTNLRISSVTGSMNTQSSSQDSVNYRNSTVTSSLNFATASLNFTSGALNIASGSYNRFYQVTASVHSTTASLNTQTGSQDLVNRGISSVTGSINTTTSSFDSVFLRISSTTGSINTQSSSQDNVNFNNSKVTASIDAHILGIAIYTASVISQTNTIATFTSSVNLATQSLNTQTGSQNSLNTSLGLITSSIYGEITSFNNVFSGVSNVTGAFSTELGSIQKHILAQAKQTASQDLVNLNISTYTGSNETWKAGIRGEVSALEAWTASLDSTYATDAQLYQLYQATASIHFTTSSINSTTASLIGITNGLMALTASMKAAAIVSSSTQVQNYDVFALNSNLYTSTGSLIGITNGIMALTASMKAAAIVSSSTQIQNYFTFAQTASVNTFYGNQIITGGLDVRDGVTGSFKGNLNGTATYAGTVSMGNSSTNQNYALVFTTAGSNGYLSQYTDAFGGMLYNPSTNKLTVSGSVEVSGSVYGNVTTQPVNGGNTASLDISNANFFTVTFADNITTHISASNVKAGQSVNILVTTGTNTTASFSTNIKQPSGSFYLPTSGSGNKDVLSLVAFDSNSLYLVAVNQMI
jgi:hypothetical protein